MRIYIIFVLTISAWASGEESEAKYFVNFPDAWNNLLEIREINREQRFHLSKIRPRRETPNIYVYPDDETEETGPWGDWEVEGTCSRTCGGGVLRETRPCNASPGAGRDACMGQDKRFKSCNNNPCHPNARDFREEQCAEFDRIPFERKMYSWIPYLKAPRKCELNCMPRGERFYYRHAKKVIDGTLCHEGDGIRRICVDGDCREIGCDGILGSEVREDKCRVCGGDGSTCNTVVGLLDAQDLTMGYHDLVLIPAGATNIQIKEVKTSNNYLALRNMTGHYYVNGNWKIDFPGSYDIAGTIFHYEKKHKSGNNKGLFALFAPESLRALGPTNEPIYVVILSQEKNPGIEFEYSIPTGSVKETSSDDRYEWSPGPWEECDASCGGGSSKREIFCVHAMTKENVPEYLCDVSAEPERTQPCNESPCKPVWVMGPWSNCTEVEEGSGSSSSGDKADEEELEEEEEGSCGSLQVQTRNVYCHQIQSQGNPTIVEDSVCEDAGEGDKPEAVKPCSDDAEDEEEEPEGPTYHVGPWTTCDALCGKDGKMTRKVTCHEIEEEETVLLDDSECSDLKKPETEKSCGDDKPICEFTDWISTPWSNCMEESCDGLPNQKTRTNLCSDAEGNILDSGLCEAEKEPIKKEACNSTEIEETECGAMWFASQWSECSSKCKGFDGVRTRSVLCVIKDDNSTFTEVDETDCDEDKRQEESETCEGEEECKGQWYSSEWGPCSADCGGGQKTRKTFCILDDSPTDPSNCDPESIPEAEDSCNEDEECSGDDEEEEECEYYGDEWIWGKEDLDNSTLIDEGDLMETEGEEGSGEDYESDDDGSGSGSGGTELSTDDLMGIFSKRCKPEPMGPCENSTYGCCPDEFNPAKGPFGDGCDAIKTCADTRYGCCRDWVTPANGSNFKGCPSSNCDEHLFGCCPDGESPAQGPEDEGCKEIESCQSGKFGCCPDDFSFAQGPNNKGCFDCPEEIWECDTCEKTLYGCCTDLETAASGPNFEGCDEGSGEQMSDCTLAEHGCCPDGITRARGPNFKGCKNATPCKSSRWGCCDDLVNPAHGPNKEGCCLNSEFGCCMDNVMAAKGLDQEGCGCEFSKYKCCPDDITPAKGQNFEGCGCQSSEFGCCPDNLTPSKGENYVGCPCYSYEFGCCPDGVSIARGPGQEGCSCKDTEFGCCPDRKTPAKGVDKLGCGCAASEFGCCPDGVVDSKGKNFEECDSLLPLPTPDVCGMPKNRGQGRNFTTRWFFDMEYGGCSKFFYGGKGGNQNNFDKKETCEDVCVNPEGRDACVLPLVPGPCEGYYPRFGYNTEEKACKQFIYGGCLGNNNKFDSIEECEGICSEDPEGVRDLNIDKCKQPILPGPCVGNFSRWGYNYDKEECEEFNYGGCRGNDNAFLTKEECVNSCKPGGFNRQMCLLPRDPGPCKDRHPKWYFDNFEKRCMPFYYGGCEGNENLFDDLESCQKSCPKEFLQADVCRLPQVPGPCGDYLERFYFDINEGVCKSFYYGGCKGNKNNFKSLEDCQSRCSVDYSIPIEQEFKLEFCFLSKDEGEVDENNQQDQDRWYYDNSDGVCKQMVFKGRKGNGNRFLTHHDCKAACWESQDVCSLPKVKGPCNGQIESHWYDKDKNSCFTFTWGGCQGNGNRFETAEFCEAKCLDSQKRPTPQGGLPVDICNLPADGGPCEDRNPSWYFNSKSEKCSAFIYSGCEGNANRFGTQEQCDRHCGLFRGQNVCKMPMDIGPCVGRFKKWYFDSRSKSCKAFTFGGCEGNGNRFSSVEECETVCLVQDEPPLPGNNTEVSRADICKLQADPGPCDDELKRWYFNETREKCAPFLYSGCAGNRNRFKNYDVCMGFCQIITPTTAQDIYNPPRGNFFTSPIPQTGDEQYSTAPPYPSEERPSPTYEPSRVNTVPEYDPARCKESDKRCEDAQCEYGLLRYRDDRSGCDQCFCNEPCQDFPCPENTECAVELYRTGEDGTETGFRPICRKINKGGICPKVSRNEYSSCEQDCSVDAHCSGIQKCCFNGCGLSCMDAVFDPSMDPYSTDEPSPPLRPRPEESRDSARIHVPIPTIIANEGDIAVLTVQVDGNPIPDVYWRLGRRDIDTRLGKYKVLSDGSLQIIGVEPSDEGVYTSLADNGKGLPAEATVTLAVDSPNELEAGIIPSEPEIVLSLGSPATLECLAYGFPKPSITWWRGRDMLPMSSEQFTQKPDYSLHIKVLTLRDLGQYSCQAFNGIGRGASHSVVVRAMGPVDGTNKEDEEYLPYVINAAPVAPQTEPPPRPEYTQEPPYGPPTPNDWNSRPTTPRSTSGQYPSVSHITVKISPMRSTYLEGERIDISCTVNSITRPNIYWFKNGQLITPDNRMQILDQGSSLRIYQASSSDGGTYTCEADNGYTSESDSIPIRVDRSEDAGGSAPDPTCTDNPYFVNCRLIVKANYCGNKYYARFCCKSCTLADTSNIERVNTFRFWIEGVALSFFSICAMVTNITSIIIFLRRKIKNSFDGFILILAIIDTFFCLFTMFDCSFARVFELNGILYTFLFPWFIYPLTNSLMCASIFMTVLLALERYIAVCKPFYFREITLSSSLKYRITLYTTPVLLFALLLNIPKFFETTIVRQMDGQSSHFSIVFTSLSNNPNYIRYYNTITCTLLTGVFPISALLFFNFKIYIRLQQTRNRFSGRRSNGGASSSAAALEEARDFQLAFVLVGIVCVFLLTNSLRLFLNIYEWIYVNTMIYCKDRFQPSSIIIGATSVSHLLLILNAGMNFIMYCCLNNGIKKDMIQSLSFFCTRKESAKG